ncbi:MAG: radical SAM protein [Candidatus Omnitrophota bacterium]|nr:MAG: radical SAM protein [Candidatus Omnitrophota bacterium]
MDKQITSFKNKEKGLLYTKIKIFHFKNKLDSLPPLVNKISSPIHIRIKPTNVCNHRCSYCAYRADNLQLGKDMVVKDQIPKEKMMEIIDDVIEMGVKAVTFSGGGEPFCYPYLLEAVKKLSQTHVKFAALTNGARLKSELAEIFAHLATWLRISIDGWDEKSYAQYRGVSEEEFKKVMNNMETFKKIGGKCYLGVSIVVDKSNSAHIYELVKKLKNIGVDSVKVSPCIVSNNGMENDKYHVSFFQAVREEIRKAIEDLADDRFHIFDAYHKLDEEFNKRYSWCPYLQTLPVIGADLNIYPCQDKAYNLSEGLIGSIKNVRFKDFWFSNKSKFFRINPSIHCNHRCVADAKNKLILDYLEADRDHLGFV